MQDLVYRDTLGFSQAQASIKFRGSLGDIAVDKLPVQIMRLFGWKPSRGGVAEGLLRLPRVLTGRLSLVGLPEEEATEETRHGVRERRTLYLGPPGLTGIVQINSRQGMAPEEIERLKL